MNNLSYYVDTYGEYYFTYNNKPVTLGVLVESKEKIDKNRSYPVNVIKPVVIEGGKILEVVKDALTGEYYNSLASSAYVSKGDKIPFNKRVIDIASAFYNIDKNKGVVSYNLYYANEISAYLREQYGKDHDLSDISIYNRLCGIYVLNKMKELIQEHEKNNQKTRTK